MLHCAGALLLLSLRTAPQTGEAELPHQLQLRRQQLGRASDPSFHVISTANHFKIALVCKPHHASSAGRHISAMAKAPRISSQNAAVRCRLLDNSAPSHLLRQRGSIERRALVHIAVQVACSHSRLHPRLVMPRLPVTPTRPAATRTLHRHMHPYLKLFYPTSSYPTPNSSSSTTSTPPTPTPTSNPTQSALLLHFVM